MKDPLYFLVILVFFWLANTLAFAQIPLQEGRSRAWTQKTSGATERAAHIAAVGNDKMYIFGGHGEDGTARAVTSLNDLWEYDISNDSWIEITISKNRPNPYGYITMVGDFPTPGTDARGLTWDGSNFWVADWSQVTIFQIDSSGNVIKSFSSPASFPTGLTWDGTYLWNADNSTNQIYKINTGSGAIVSSFAAPSGFPSGLAWDGTNLWNTDTYEGKIYKIDPNSGSVLSSFSTPNGGGFTSSAGLTFNGTHLVYTHGLPAGPIKVIRFCLLPEV